MASFKLCISDPSTGRSYQKEVKDNMATPFIGLNIGESVKGDGFEMNGYEFQVTGGSDYCGFPMRRGILGQRKKITIYAGIGFRGGLKGIKRRKTICGHKIHERISQINLKVVKEGPKKLNELFGMPEGEKNITAADEKQEDKPEKKAAGQKQADDQKAGDKKDNL
ncbi:30S ribosomal protein S6e [Candidatus Woesearchaeota archaeon]|nr:30S ribosomal protein S6e [Candidatus Woesearchaeota archaeon]